MRGQTNFDPVDPMTFYELKAFYADQLGARDQGDTDGWLDAFEDTATLTTNLFDGTSTLEKADFTPKVHQLDADFNAAGIQRRHSSSTYSFTQNDDGTVSGRFYTILFATGADGVSGVHSTSVAQDLLTRTDGGWRVLSRRIRRDDLAQR